MLRPMNSAPKIATIDPLTTPTRPVPRALDETNIAIAHTSITTPTRPGEHAEHDRDRAVALHRGRLLGRKARHHLGDLRLADLRFCGRALSCRRGVARVDRRLLRVFVLARRSRRSRRRDRLLRGALLGCGPFSRRPLSRLLLGGLGSRQLVERVALPRRGLELLRLPPLRGDGS